MSSNCREGYHLVEFGFKLRALNRGPTLTGTLLNGRAISSRRKVRDFGA